MTLYAHLPSQRSAYRLTIREDRSGTLTAVQPLCSANSELHNPEDVNSIRQTLKMHECTREEYEVACREIQNSPRDETR